MDFVAIDLETANPNMHSVCQIGVVRFENGVETDCAVQLVDPGTWFDPYNVGIHGIDEAHIAGAPTFIDLHGWLHEWTRGRVVVCHAHFDRVALKQACARDALPELDCTWLDSAKVCRRAWAEFAERGYGLANVARHCGIQFEHHDALHDARTAGLILLRAIEETGNQITQWLDLVGRPISTAQAVRRAGDGDGALNGEAIVFTGALQMPRVEAAARAAAAGGDVLTGVTRFTTMLVVGDQDIWRLNGQTKSGKHRKAETLIADGQRLRIVGETDFMELSAIQS